MRFYRDYELNIFFDGQQLIIRPPLRMQFEAEKKNNNSSLGKASLTLYNLKESTRVALSKDQHDDKLIHVSLAIGYDDRLQRLVSGDIFSCTSKRDGNDYITTIQMYDGGFDYNYSFTNKTVRTKEQAITSILQDMPNTSKGKVTKMCELLRPKVMIGNTYHIINELIDKEMSYYIDHGQLFIVKPNEVISKYEPLVSAATGLLSTSENKANQASFVTLLNPGLRLSGNCVLQSQYTPHLNGLYRIDEIKYKGDTDGKNWSQTVSASLISEYEVLE